MKEMKKRYEKPSMVIYEIQHESQLLAGSPYPVDPNPSPYQW